jgi:predicted transglutaminase-like cysteine proteinase
VGNKLFPLFLLTSLFIFSAVAAESEQDLANRRIKSWQALIQDNQNLSDTDKLKKVNAFFNQWQYASDEQIWGKPDYWATPLEFVEKGEGDCEDFAIAKFDALQQMRVSEDKILICYTKIKLPHHTAYQPHVLVAYFAKNERSPLILDNFNKEILTAKERSDLKALYCFNHLGFWQVSTEGKKRYIGRSTDIKKWQEMEKRRQLEAKKLHETP